MARAFATQEHCANNHPWTPETTRKNTSGRKICKLCQRAAYQKHKDRPITPDTVPIGTRNRDKTVCPAGHDYATWGRTKGRGDGVGRYCTICHRHNRVRTMYGVTIEQWDGMVLSQEGRCGICWTILREPHVDHDHTDGHVRELLCTSCNNGLGRFFDNPDLLRAAAAYLDRHARG